MQNLAAALALVLFAADPPQQFTPGHVFVGVTDNSALVSAIHEYDRDGTFVREIALSGFGVSRMDFGPDGLLYVVRSFRVDAISPDGTLAASFDVGGTLDPGGLAFGPSGHLCVTDFNTDSVLELDASGNVVRTIGAGSGMGGPQDLAFGADGHLYVASFTDSKIYEFDPTGEKVRTWDGGGALASLRSVEFDAAGGLLFSANAPTPTIGILGEDDSVEQTYSLGNTLSPPAGFALDAFGSLFYTRVPSTGPRMLVRIDPDGTKVETEVNGQNWTPGAVAVAPWHLKGKLKGSRVEDGQPSDTLKAAVDLYLWPGEGRAAMHIAPSPLADAVGDKLVFRGRVAHKGASHFAGSFHGVLLSSSPRTGRSGALSLRLASKNDTGFKGKAQKVRLFLSEPSITLDLKGTFKPVKP